MQEPTLKNQDFLYNSVYDFEIIPSLMHKIGCSQATIYRILIQVNMPIYHLPYKRSQVVIHGWDLWRIAGTAAWKKYLKRRGYKLYRKRKLRRLLKLYADSDVITLYSEGSFKGLTLAEVVSAVDCGLIPVDSKMNLPALFISSVLGLLRIELPRKV